MAISVTALSGAVLADAVDRNAYTVGSATYTSGRYYLLGVTNCKGSTPDAINSASNAHITFASLGTVTFDSIASPTKRVSIWGATASGSGTATLAVDFNGVTQIGCNACVLEVTGHNTSTPIRTGSPDNNTSNAADNVASGASFVITLEAALASASNAIVCFGSMNLNAVMDAQNSYNELYDDGHGTPACRLLAMWLINGGDPTFEKTTAAANIEYAGVCVEVNEASVGGGGTKIPLFMHHYKTMSEV